MLYKIYLSSSPYLYQGGGCAGAYPSYHGVRGRVHTGQVASLSNTNA